MGEDEVRAQPFPAWSDCYAYRGCWPPSRTMSGRRELTEATSLSAARMSYFSLGPWTGHCSCARQTELWTDLQNSCCD